MSDYKDRMKNEAIELKERITKLSAMITKYYEGSLSFEFTCPICLLEMQLNTMTDYYNILVIRAKIEGIEL